MVDVLNDPHIKGAIRLEQMKDGMCAQLGQLLISTKTWETMTGNERKVCVRYIASDSSSEIELSRRLNDIGCTDCAICWKDTDPNDKTSLEARALIKALGGLVSKNGALVMMMTADDQF